MLELIMAILIVSASIHLIGGLAVGAISLVNAFVSSYVTTMFTLIGFTLAIPVSIFTLVAALA